MIIYVDDLIKPGRLVDAAFSSPAKFQLKNLKNRKIIIGLPPEFKHHSVQILALQHSR